MDEWTVLAPDPNPIMGFSICAYRGQIYNVGVRYPSKTIGAGQTVKERLHAEMFIYKNELYVFGGDVPSSNCPTIERYDPDAETFSLVSQGLLKLRIY